MEKDKPKKKKLDLRWSKMIPCKHDEERDLIPLYDRRPDTYHSVSLNGLASAMRALNVPPARTVLDLGCGDGRFSVWLSKRGARVDGVDYSVRRIGAAITKTIGDVVFVHDDIHLFMEDCPFNYEMILFIEVLEHLKDPTSAIEAAKKLLDLNGRIVASVPLKAPGDTHLRPGTQQTQ